MHKILTQQDLLGVWTLEDFIIHRENGEEFHWPGPQNGTLIYTYDGFVSVAQNRQPLPNPTPEDRQRESNFYTAHYELDLEHGRVFHTILQSSVPAIIGQRAERQVSLLEDGRLKLSGQGLKERVTLVWKRVESRAGDCC
jgi:hypothetical protein